MVFLLLMGGHESTAHLISGSVLVLLENPDQRRWLQADWDRAGLAVEEFLRFHSPEQFSNLRYACRDMTFDNVTIRRNDQVMAMLVAANHDPVANEEPKALRLDRQPNSHIAFGSGVHHCLGHHLARIEAKAALTAIFMRWPRLSLALPPSKARWRKRFGMRGVAELRVCHPPSGTEPPAVM